MRTLYLAMVWLHIVGATIWIGGMVMAAFVMLPQIRQLQEPERSRFRWRFLRRFRAVMWGAFAVVGVSGLLVLALRGVQLDDLLDPAWHSTTFGRVISLKIGLYAAGGALTLLHERARSGAQARALGRLVLGLGLATVLLAVVLIRGL